MDRHSEDESSEDETLLDPQPDGQRRQARVRQIPQNFNMLTFNNEINKDKEVPTKHCAICCRLLYPEDYCKLSMAHKTKIEEMFVKDMQTAHRNDIPLPDIEKITWPLVNYRKLNGTKRQDPDYHFPKKGEEYVIVCARHKSSGAQNLKTIMDYVS